MNSWGMTETGVRMMDYLRQDYGRFGDEDIQDDIPGPSNSVKIW